jgi:uncharacterized UBP type Zn finger protein
MENPANVCFANSIIQALSACPSFVFYLLNNRAAVQTASSELDFNNKLLAVLLALNQTSQVKTQRIDELVGDLESGQLDFSQQQDSHEFLKALCDKLETVEKLKLASLDSLAGFGKVSASTAAEFPFSGKMIETLECRTCGSPGVSQVVEFFDLTFHVNFTQPKTIEQLFEEFFAGEGREGVYCAKCSLQWFLQQLTPPQREAVEERLAGLSASDVQNFETLGSLIRIGGGQDRL